MSTGVWRQFNNWDQSSEIDKYFQQNYPSFKNSLEKQESLELSESNLVSESSLDYSDLSTELELSELSKSDTSYSSDEINQALQKLNKILNLRKHLPID